jgi:CRP/FNR family cyclic AMP-dependent transcriptional regulator
MSDPTDHFYLLLDGRVRTSIIGDGGQEFILQDVGPGEAFGELCFCEVRARQEQAVALEPSRVARIGLPELAAFSDGQGLWQIVEMFTHRLADLERQLQEVSTAPVRERLLHFLERQATSAVDGEGFARLAGVFTHQEIAARIFTTREQVSAHLASLRRQGMVRYGRGQSMAVRLSGRPGTGR